MKLKKDSKFEGRDKFFVDLDRMTSDGLAGGTVTNKYDHPQIEEAQNLEEEEPPRKM